MNVRPKHVLTGIAVAVGRILSSMFGRDFWELVGILVAALVAIMTVLVLAVAVQTDCWPWEV